MRRRPKHLQKKKEAMIRAGALRVGDAPITGVLWGFYAYVHRFASKLLCPRGGVFKTLTKRGKATHNGLNVLAAREADSTLVFLVQPCA